MNLTTDKTWYTIVHLYSGQHLSYNGVDDDGGAEFTSIYYEIRTWDSREEVSAFFKGADFNLDLYRIVKWSTEEVDP